MKQNIHRVMELLEADGEYQALEKQRLEKLEQFRTVVGMLTQEQKDAIIDYVGICEEQHWLAVEVLLSRCDQ